jgi:DNA-binding response OmpR family regulator
MKILLIEDDPILSDLIHEFLSEMYDVDQAYSAEEAYDILDIKKFALIISDINMPGISGLEFLKSLREYDDTTPFIVITAYQDLDHLKQGFEYGVNDYLRKPFELEELRLRITNIQKQLRIETDKTIQIDTEVLFDPTHKTIQNSTSNYSLKPKESELLHYLINHPKRAISYGEITQNLWTYEETPSEATIRTYIKTLRKYIGKDKITTLYGSGYIYESHSIRESEQSPDSLS